MIDGAGGAGTARRPRADRAGAGRLRAFLGEAGFAAEGVARLLGLKDEFRAGPNDLPVCLRRLEETSAPVATLVRLFVLRVAVPRETAERDLAPLGLEPFVECGLVEAAVDEVRPLVKLVPHDELLFASDFTPDERLDHVAGIHRPSATLAYFSSSNTRPTSVYFASKWKSAVPVTPAPMMMTS